MIEYICPHCNSLLTLDASDVSLDENFLCPVCHQPAFPEALFDDEN